MMAALQQQLVTTIAHGLFNFSPVSGHVRDIGVGVAGYAIEIAEFAVGDTDIGGIDIPVYLPGDLSMGHGHFPKLVGEVHELCEGGVLEEKDAFFHV